MYKIVFDLEKLYAVVGFLIFILMLIVPTNYMIIKISLIVFLFTRIIVFRKSMQFQCNKIILFVIFLIILKGIIWLLYGMLHGNPVEKILSLFPFLCLWPLLYLSLILNISSKQVFYFLCRIILYAHVFIVFYNLYALFSVFVGLEPFSFFESEAIFVASEDSYGISNPSLQQLVFTTPFFFTLMITDNLNIFNRFWAIVIFFMTIFVMILSSRGIMILILGLLPLIPFSVKFISNNIKYNFSKFYFFMFIVLVVSSTYLFSTDMFENVINPLVEKFDEDTDIVRFSQRKMLLDIWRDNPFVGNGYGTVYFDSIRGKHDGVESMYHADLANTGLIGFSFFIFYILLIFYWAIKLYRSSNDIMIFACVLGLFFYLLASATNPFLASFDRMYPIYLTLSIFNVYQQKKSRILTNI